MTDEEIHMRLQSVEDYPGQLRGQVSAHNSTIKLLQTDLQALMEDLHVITKDYVKSKQTIYTTNPELLI